ncbi:unnamed protein product [Spirodela intermedia]|uniref:Uncharacterized protein n=1 Tax=Spirodela intermedia TaxID=51605 RepID=A0A7I8JNT0_SPIIN|nr:unnamed protein product [Spirodela intermedia]CAA6671112.1 unnamed protein product [Spirodela intermedia]
MASSAVAPLPSHRNALASLQSAAVFAKTRSDGRLRSDRFILFHHGAASRWLVGRSPKPPIAKFWFQGKESGRGEVVRILPLRSQFEFPDGVQRLARKIVAAIAAALFCFGAGISAASVDGRLSSLETYSCEDVAGYYAGLEGLDGAALMRRLSAVVSAHRSLTYKEVWDALKILDAADPSDPEHSSDVIEIYSLRAVSKTLAGKSEGWNREHLWPRSYGLIDKPSLTDLHNLRPADVNINSSRGNKYYGECVSESNVCLRPANREAAPDTEADSKKWAPPFQVRGDVARSLMYMAVSYGMYQPGEGPHLKLSDSPISNREMGLLSTLLKWNEFDPPSKAEKLRNERVCRLYQHNRNPFIDHPEYANLIWTQTQSRSLLTYKSSMAWINEFHYDNKGKDENEFVEIMADPSIDATKLMLLLYNGSTGKVYKSLMLGDSKAFAVTDHASRFSIYTAFVPLQNGPRDGMALVSLADDNQPKVIQFLSYEGTLTPTDGPARGIESVDVNLQETEASGPHDSLGLIETASGEPKWAQFKGTATPGKPNVGQRL